jgi:fermentation-respiration switch protein FrsA (DUF1100 family)
VIAALRFFLLSVALAYAGICLYMFLQQRSLQYFPTHRGPSPAEAGFSQVSDETIATPDGETISAWYAEAAPGKPTILYFQGNGGEIADRTGRLGFYLSHGFGVLFVSYRGYGRSTGAISEQGLIADALAAHAWLTARGVKPEQVVLVGESLGTGVAVQLASQRQVQAVALEAPYSSAADIAASIYWWLPVRLLMKDTFHSQAFIQKVHAPLLIVHGDADTIIPVAQGRKLFAMANEPKELVIIPGEGHDVIHDPRVWELEVAFFTGHQAPLEPSQ